jgi:hypothetical protein
MTWTRTNGPRSAPGSPARDCHKKIVHEVQWLPPDPNDNRSESSRNSTDRASSPSKSACSYSKRSIRIGSPSRGFGIGHICQRGT